jgi:hypothetical protein
VTKDVTLTVVVTLDYDASTDEAVDFLEGAIDYAAKTFGNEAVRGAVVLVPEDENG